jgi:hypothetical protein
MTTHEIYALLMGVGIGTIFGVALSVSMRSLPRDIPKLFLLAEQRCLRVALSSSPV